MSLPPRSELPRRSTNRTDRHFESFRWCPASLFAEDTTMTLARVFMLSTMVLCAAPDQVQQSTKPTSKQRARKPAAQTESRQASMTGCLDQRGEAYVLRSAEDAKRLTTL